MHRNDFENSRNTFRLGQSRHEASMSGSLSTGSGEFHLIFDIFGGRSRQKAARSRHGANG
jgi:hypothetical protein